MTLRTFQITVNHICTVHVLDSEQYLVEYELYVSRGHVLVRSNDLRQIRVHKVEHTGAEVKDGGSQRYRQDVIGGKMIR